MRDEVEAETGHRCGIYASSIHYDGELHEKMEDAVNVMENHVDENYSLPLYGQVGLAAGAGGTTPMASNVGWSGPMREPLLYWSVFTEGHITCDGKLTAGCFDHDGYFDMGDLNKKSVIEIRHS